MPTFKMTFLQATYDLMTFVHISNISANTDRILFKFFETKFSKILLGTEQIFRPKVFFIQHFFGIKHFFGPNIFWTPNSFRPNFCFNPTFIEDQTFFLSQNIFNPKIFPPKLFLTQVLFIIIERDSKFWKSLGPF